MKRKFLIAAAAYLLLLIILFYPLSVKPDRYFFNGYFSGTLLWDLYIFDKYAVKEHSFPYYINDMRYPSGGYIVFAGWNIMLPASILNLFLSIQSAYNITIILTFLAGALLMYLFLYRMTASAPASFVGGFIFAFSPFAFSVVFNGHMEKLIYMALPLFVWLLLLYFEKKKAGYAVAAVLLFMIMFASELYIGVTAGIFLLAYAAYRIASGRFNIRIIIASAAVIAACGIVALPNYLYLKTLISKPYGKLMKIPSIPKGELDPVKKLNPYKAPNAMLKYFAFTDKKQLDLIFKDKTDSIVIHVYYLGLVNILLLASGLFFRIRKKLALWYGMLALFLVISLGSALYIGRAPLLIAGKPLFLPLYFVTKLISQMQYFSNSYRACAMLYFSAAVIISFLMSFLIRGKNARVSAPLCLLVLAAVFLDYKYLSPTGYRANIEAYGINDLLGRIGSDRRDYAVIEFPFIFDYNLYEVKTADYSIHQVQHGKKVPHTLSNEKELTVRRIPLVENLIKLYLGGAPDPDAAAAAERSAGYFREYSYRLFLLNEYVFTDRLKLKAVKAYLDRAFAGRDRYSSGGITVYVLDPALSVLFEGLPLPDDPEPPEAGGLLQGA